MLKWYESDGVTGLTVLDFGKVGPGESYYSKHEAYLQLVLKNTGAASVDQTVAELVQVSTFPFYEYARFAIGEVEPELADFVGFLDPPLPVGLLEPAASVKVWFNLIVPSFANRGSSQYASVRAYGNEV